MDRSRIHKNKRMKTKRKAKVEIKKTTSGAQKGAWRYTIIGANGKTMAASEGYTSKSDAERGMADLSATILTFIGDNLGDWIRRHT